jgi:VIT1/CCC1 family predicted Fe2+/Mn2+ transporter
MAAGEYISVHSQRDLEQAAALDKERAELEADADAEHKELAAIHVRRGLDAELAAKVSAQLRIGRRAAAGVAAKVAVRLSCPAWCA